MVKHMLCLTKWSSQSMNIVIEYLIKCKIAEVSAKIVYSNNPY